MTKLNPPTTAALGTTRGKLRLLYAFERAHASTPPLSPAELSDVRAFTGARVIYALTAAKVAGAVTQTNFYDYRTESQERGKHSHSGAPVSSVEIVLKDTEGHKTTDDRVEGEVNCFLRPFWIVLEETY